MHGIRELVEGQVEGGSQRQTSESYGQSVKNLSRGKSYQLHTNAWWSADGGGRQTTMIIYNTLQSIDFLPSR